jgi:hypothetical protein
VLQDGSHEPQQATFIMVERQREYMAYLVRIWSVRGKGRTVWRASLENAHTGESHGFDTLDDLFDYVRARTAEMTDSGARGH